MLLQDVREAADFVVERLVRVDLAAPLVALPDKSGLVATPSGEVPVDAVVGDIGLTALEPLDARSVELPVKDLVPLLVPVQVRLGLLGPEALGIIHRATVHLLVLVHRLDPSTLGDPRRRVNDL